MKVRIALVAFLVVPVLFLFAGSSQAVMHRVVFNAWTQTQAGQPDKLLVYVETHDDMLHHPPDFVKEIRITAPDGTIKYLSLSKTWRHWDRAFIWGFVASDFNGKVIPGGTYTVRVTPDAGSAITETDVVAAKFIQPATLTYPTNNLTGVPEMPTLKWGAVKGATSYRIYLFFNGGDPLFFRMNNVKTTDFNSYKIPPGVLKPNTTFRVQIEANAASQDLDMRSQSLWIVFTTGNW